MCGIAGIWDFNSAVTISHIKQMTDVLAHRGPDGEGLWSSADGKLALGHRRLSIIDLSEKGVQPMHYAERYTLTYNGEIYNYTELKESLLKKGYAFRTNTDSEVLLAAYHEYKEDCLKYFDGMFAFAIWDAVTETLFCARDRFGEKPFYYIHEKQHSFRFASEMKALWADGVSKDLNQKMLFYYLAYNVVENPYDKSETFYRNISRLEAAHYLLLQKDGTLVKKRYWQIDSSLKSELRDENAAERFRELFFLSIGRRLRADVPVGSSLSGGLDSSSVVCAIHQVNEKKLFSQNTFSARFKDDALDEGKYMDEISAVTDTHRHDVWVDEQTLLNNLDKVLYHQEEPMADASPLAQWCVMHLAKEKGVTVLLDGQGADEVLAGYTHFFRPYFSELFLTDKTKFRKELVAYAQLRGQPFDATISFRMHAYFPSTFRTIGKWRRQLSTPGYLSFLSPEFVTEFKNEPPPFSVFNSLNESLLYFTTIYGLEKLLRYADRNSMAASREVRLPFLSHELVEYIFSLPASCKIHNGWTKFILRSSMANILPASITWRVGKLGYQPPFNSWLKQKDVAERVSDSSSELYRKHFLRQPVIVEGKEWQILNVATLF